MTRSRDSVIPLHHDRGTSRVHSSNDYRPTTNGNGYSNDNTRKLEWFTLYTTRPRSLECKTKFYMETKMKLFFGVFLLYKKKLA